MKKYKYDQKTLTHKITLYGKFYSWLIKHEIYCRLFRVMWKNELDFKRAKIGKKLRDINGNFYYQ